MMIVWKTVVCARHNLRASYKRAMANLKRKGLEQAVRLSLRPRCPADHRLACDANKCGTKRAWGATTKLGALPLGRAIHVGHDAIACHEVACTLGQLCSPCQQAPCVRPCALG